LRNPLTYAAVILVLLAHGWWMTHMTPRSDRLANYAWHSALGYDLFALIILRLLWRWFNPVPELPFDLKPWERIAANVGHIALMGHARLTPLRCYFPSMNGLSLLSCGSATAKGKLTQSMQTFSALPLIATDIATLFRSVAHKLTLGLRIARSACQWNCQT
jgi:cytochrome b561